jgi:DnaK suppressor protein
MADENSLDLADIRRRLEAERDSLKDLARDRAADQEPVTLDQQSVGRVSRMDAMQVQAMAQAVAERRDLRLRLIDAALTRLDKDTYGFCVDCGEDILAARLEADLTNPRCVDCAR